MFRLCLHWGKSSLWKGFPPEVAFRFKLTWVQTSDKLYQIKKVPDSYINWDNFVSDSSSLDDSVKWIRYQAFRINDESRIFCPRVKGPGLRSGCIIYIYGQENTVIFPTPSIINPTKTAKEKSYSTLKTLYFATINK